MKTKKLLSFVAAATMTITALAGSLSASVIGASAVDVQVTPNRGSWKMTSISGANQLVLNQNESNCKIAGFEGKNDFKITFNVSGITEASAAYVILSASGGGQSFSAWNSSDYQESTCGITNPYTLIPSDGKYSVTLHSETAFPENTNFSFLGVGFTKNTTSTAGRNVNAELVSVTIDNGLSIVKSGNCGENATFELYSDGTMKISGTGAIKLSDAKSGSETLTSISQKIKSVEIEEGITELAEDCFKGFTVSFNKITLPSTLTTIGKNAFRDCRMLEEIDIPDSVTSIGEMAFNLNSSVLTNIKVPAGVTEIPDNAFSSCYQLRTITIGENVTSIGKMAFAEAERTKDVYIYSRDLETVEPFKIAVEQTEYGNEGYYVNVESSFDKYNNTVFHVYRGSKTEQTLRDAHYIEKDSDVSYIDDETPVTPPTVEPAETVDSGKCGDNVKWTLDANGVLTLSGKGNMTEEIKDDAWFYRVPEWEFADHKADIRKVVVGKDVTSIGREAFKDSAVAEIEFEAKVFDSRFKIGREAFSGCANLTKFDLSDKLMGISYEQFIGYAAFQNCTSLETVILPDGSASIDIAPRAFMGCTALKNVLFPQSVDFNYSQLKDKTIYITIEGTEKAICHSPIAIGGQFAGCTALEGVYFFDSFDYAHWYGDEESSIFFKDGEKEAAGEEKWAEVYLYADPFDADTNAEFYFNTIDSGNTGAKCYALNELRRTTNIEKLNATNYLTNGDHELAQSSAYSSLETWIDFAEMYEGKKGFVDDQGKINIDNIYTDETYAAFKTAFETAKSVDTTPGARDYSNILIPISDDYTYTKSMKAVVPLARDIETFTNALKTSIDNLKGKPCNYDRIDEAIAQIPEDLSIYTDYSTTALRRHVGAIDRTLTMENGHQQLIFLWAEGILDDIARLEYKPADFTAVDEAISKVPEDLTIYTDETVKVLTDALDAVDRTKNITEQETVDTYVKPILDAIDALVLKKADYTAVDNAIAKVPADLSKYTDATVKALKDAINAVDRNKNITEQAVVDGYAKAINDAISALKLKATTTTKPTAKTTAKPTRNAKQVAKDKAAAKKAMKQAKITKLTVKSKAKKKINVSWKKVKKAKGYQVQVSAKKNFKKVIFNKDLKKTKLTIKSKKIKSKKTYCVRVRAYATYKNKNNKTVKVYSKWNKKLRKVKVK